MASEKKAKLRFNLCHNLSNFIENVAAKAQSIKRCFERPSSQSILSETEGQQDKANVTPGGAVDNAVALCNAHTCALERDVCDPRRSKSLHKIIARQIQVRRCFISFLLEIMISSQI